jgi:hypothetical protein
MRRIVFMHFVFSDMQNEKVFLAEPLQMTDVFLTDNMSFLKSASLELPGPDLRDIMGKDRPDGFVHRDCSGSGFLSVIQWIAHTNLLLLGNSKYELTSSK